MSKILINTTASPIFIADTGTSLPVGNFTINAANYSLWAASSDIIVQIGNNNIIVNDGSVNLSIANGTSLLQGIFPSTVIANIGTISTIATETTLAGIKTDTALMAQSVATADPGTAGIKSTLAGGKYNSTLPTLTSGQQVGLQVDNFGRLITNQELTLGSTPPGALAARSTLIGGTFNTFPPTVANGQQAAFQMDSAGNLLVKNSSVQSYSATFTNLNPPNSPTDIFTIIGSATKTIKITRVALTANQNTAAQRDILLIKRSAANAGGTSTLASVVPHDSNNAAATAAVRGYTVNPTTLGASVGTLRTKKVFIGSASGNSDEFILDFGSRPAQEIVLNGVAQTLSLNLNGATSSGGVFNISVEWTES